MNFDVDIISRKTTNLPFSFSIANNTNMRIAPEERLQVTYCLCPPLNDMTQMICLYCLMCLDTTLTVESYW